MNKDQLRDDIAAALCVDHGHSRQEGGANCRTCSRRSDAVLEVVAPLLPDVGRVAYLEARVGELNQQLGDARALAEKRLVAREDWKTRCLAAEASRRDWATEALRLDASLEEIAERCDELSAKVDAKIGEIAGADIAWAAWGKAAQWMRKARTQPDPASRPVCAVHPEGGQA